MRLYAISDLHLLSEINRQALAALPAHPEDWLILGGDIGETEELLRLALSILTRRFKHLIWVPGNHDLWTLPSDRGGLRGEAKYQRLVSICRDHGVSTPEDPYAVWNGAGTEYLIAPLFLLYDYSFRPDDVPPERAVEWAAEAGILCADEVLLHPEPYASRADWCGARCRYTAARLQAAAGRQPWVLVNHFPLRRDLARLWGIPRFSLWCGTRRTEEWHARFPAAAVVYGHLHIRGTHWRDGVRFEEVSLGYPNDWHHSKACITICARFYRQPRPRSTAGGISDSDRSEFLAGPSQTDRAGPPPLILFSLCGGRHFSFSRLAPLLPAQP